MKKCILFSHLFVLLAFLLATGVLVICLTQTDSDPKILGSPQQAALCTQEFLNALNAGDFQGASKLLYGCPTLHPDASQVGEAGQLIWSAFTSSLEFSHSGEYYPVEGGIGLDVAVQSLDLPTLLQSMEQSAPQLLESSISHTKKMSDVYNEDHNYRDDFLQSVLRSSAETALETAAPLRRSLCLTLIHDGKQWWVSPDEAVLFALSGGLLE